jgi:hypothetical protein
MVSADENMELTLPFSPVEVRRAIMEMKADSAPGRDGLPVIPEILGEGSGGDYANVPGVLHWNLSYVSA